MKSHIACTFIVLVSVAYGRAQEIVTQGSPSTETLKRKVQQLELQVGELQRVVKQLQSKTIESETGTPEGGPKPRALSAQPPAKNAADPSLAPEERKIIDFMKDTTINVYLDTYYDYNFNNPIGRVNLLRSYDVLGNEFNLSQAAVVFDHPPDPAGGRRWGGRLDLQFGQATDTLQGNPQNEPRPQIYRNVFQAYGTYIIPIGRGLNVDFGKWGSSLGIEGNYTKDQMNYSRSYWFDFLPFYHMGLRASLPLNDRVALNYWIVNGTNQVEATNGFKDQLFGFTATPVRALSLTFNYYLGQEHPDRTPATNCRPIPIQPGLCFTAIRPAPNGLTNIFDTYATWKATPKLTFAIEGDYLTQRLWQSTGPGRPANPLTSMAARLMRNINSHPRSPWPCVRNICRIAVDCSAELARCSRKARSLSTTGWPMDF